MTSNYVSRLRVALRRKRARAREKRTGELEAADGSCEFGSWMSESQLDLYPNLYSYSYLDSLRRRYVILKPPRSSICAGR